MSESLDLAELLCARLCHDLSGLLGSLLGVLEIAREEQGGSETLGLAETTAAELATRLKLLRAAWTETGEALDLPMLGMSPAACRVPAVCNSTSPVWSRPRSFRPQPPG